MMINLPYVDDVPADSLSAERFRLIAATLSEAIWLADFEARKVIYVSPAYATIWHRSCASLYENPLSFLAAIHADDRQGVIGDLRAAMESGTPFEQEFRVIRADGSACRVLNRGFPVAVQAGLPSCYVGVAEDVTVRRGAEERLRQAATVFENTREAVMITDLDSRILAVNRAFTEISGYPEEEVLGELASIQRSGRHGPEFFQAMWASLLSVGQWQGEVWHRRKSGEVYPSWMSISTVRDEAQKPTHYVAVFSDISQLKHSEEQLSHLAHYDPLTDLPNRLLLQSRLEHALDRAERHDQRAAVLFIDLDRFKTVNDSLGHVVGDQLLIDVAKRLRERVRDEDTLGRFGGDEFLLIIEPVDKLGEVATIARDILEVLAVPFRLAGGNEAFIGASIGIAVFPEDGLLAADLLRDADAAMYQAKQQGRNGFCFYTADMNVNAIAQLELEAALRRSVDNRAFVLHYQPKVDLRSGCIVGAEALIRWPREGGVIESPARFIPLAEKTGLIVPIGSWVIDEACRQLREWDENGCPDMRVAVNVSGRQFYSSELVSIVAASLRRHQVKPDRLELEVTESMLMEDPEQTILILHALKGIGVQLALDDFGTGYSSFAYLSRFPFDTLKIDQSFVRNIATEPEATMIAVSIIDLAHRMQIKVVAEGVETETQLGYLRLRNCDAMQGYLFAKPMPAEQFSALVASGRGLQPIAPGIAVGDLLAPPGGAAKGGGRQRTILFVDDEDGILSSLRRLFRPDGYRILTANGGHAGLELLAQNEVDVILSDQRMPGMTGVDFLRRVKSIHPQIVRMVLSGYTELQTITDAINEGAIYKFLMKPWDDGLLRANVEDAFRFKEAADESRRLLAEQEIVNKELVRENAQLRAALARLDPPRR